LKGLGEIKERIKQIMHEKYPTHVSASLQQKS
jgi:hypothetical protein